MTTTSNLSTSDHPGELADRVGGTWHIETAAPETGTAHTIRVGVLSRLPLTTFDPVAAFPDKLRAIQQGDKPTDNTTAGPTGAARAGPHPRHRRRSHRRPFQVEAADLSQWPINPLDEGERARFGADALYRRAAEAVTARATATDLLKSDHEASVMVLGDLNDEVEAATTQILNGPTGSEIGTALRPALHGDRQWLWNLAPRIPEAQRFSRIYRGRKELIDHIFVSHALDEIDLVLPSPPLQDVPVGRPPFLVMTCGLTEDTNCQGLAA